MIREISAFETFSVRHPVLRSGKPIESCSFDDDNLETTKHFGFFVDNNLVGVISLLKKGNNLFSEKEQYQIRGMAVLENHRKNGFAEALVKHCEQFVRKNQADFIWFNARLVAIGFYEKLGYKILGKEFKIGDIGIHFLMYNHLID